MANLTNTEKLIELIDNIKLKLNELEDAIPVKLSELENDEGFITKAVDDLVNYYTKTETYTKTEVNTLISNFGGFEVVSSLPTENIKTNIIYLKGPIGSGNDKYEEYIYSNSTWTLIGETTVDLTNYYTKTQTDALLDEKQDALTAGDGISIANKVISNTGVLTVNGEDGDVVVNDVKKSATAPTNPTEGMVWYDTTNDVLKTYDGTDWNEVGVGTGDIRYEDFEFVTMTGTVIENLSSKKSITANTTLTAGTSLSEGMQYLVLVTNDSSVKRKVTFGSDSFELDPNETKQLVFLATSHNTLELQKVGEGTAITVDDELSTTSTNPVQNKVITEKIDELESGIVPPSSTEPASASKGMLWYDTTNDVLKVYDGTDWNPVDTDTTYTAGEGIEIKNGKDYSAMKGPAPDGFHVPLNTEWQAVVDIRAALGGGSSDGTNFGIALKLPFAGYRFFSDASARDQSSNGQYWSSLRYNVASAYILSFDSTSINPQGVRGRAYGVSVRCFKDTPTIPTSSWIKLYGTSIEAGGIFWNSTDGLISLSSDGNTWITIADKNLGATTVWNSEDTLSEANCGKYYQRGNNYGFPRTGTIANQSTTQVDASAYGPGNYYSSDTFIKYNGRWDTTDNGNLRGGVTGVVEYNNSITNTGVLSVNGQTGDVTIPSAENTFDGTPYTQNEYDALPSTKDTDGIWRVIYE